MQFVCFNPFQSRVTVYNVNGKALRDYFKYDGSNPMCNQKIIQGQHIICWISGMGPKKEGSGACLSLCGITTPFSGTVLASGSGEDQVVVILKVKWDRVQFYLRLFWMSSDWECGSIFRIVCLLCFLVPDSTQYGPCS